MENILRGNRYFEWRNDLTIKGQVSLMLLFTFLTGVSALVKIPLGFTPVPITAQTLVVLLAGLFLKKEWALKSQLLYITMGVMGVKWFSGGRAGLSVLTGATGGYLIGFVIASYLIAYIREKYDNNTSFIANLLLLFGTGLLVIFGLGLFQLAIWFRVANGEFLPINSLLNMGLNPFLLGDIIKISLAIFVANTFKNN